MSEELSKQRAMLQQAEGIANEFRNFSSEMRASGGDKMADRLDASAKRLVEIITELSSMPSISTEATMFYRVPSPATVTSSPGSTVTSSAMPAQPSESAAPAPAQPKRGSAGA